MEDGQVIDSARLAVLLATGNAADEACRQELVGGARFLGISPPGPVAYFQDRYSGRIEHWREGNIRFVGEDAVSRLARSGHSEVRIAGVEGRDSYVVFLAPDEGAVVATLGVDGNAPGQPFAG